MKLELTDCEDGKHLIGEFHLDDFSYLHEDHPDYLDGLTKIEYEFGVCDFSISGIPHAKLTDSNASGGYTSNEIEPSRAPIAARRIGELIAKSLAAHPNPYRKPS